MKLEAPRGRLLAIGGHEDKGAKCEILKEFVRLAKGKASLVVMTIAAKNAKELGKEYARVFRNFGVKDITVVDISTREDTHTKKSVLAIEKATGVFFTGGDALDVTGLLGGTEIDRLLHKRYEEGMILGGTSAGAAMMSHAIIIDGESDANPRLSDVQIAPGEEFIMGAIIDTHFSQRGRHGRLISAVAQHPHDLGIGIDENTAILLEDHQFRVLGEGAVTVIDVGSAKYTNVPDAKEGESLALYDVKMHILPAGHGFDLEAHQPLMKREAEKQKEERKKSTQKRDHSKKSKSKNQRTK
ncbi:MAG: cyanophycinase [Nitrospirae bacterium]|nr:cyanophycinase [Nitrospirota bacterium]